MKKAGYVLAIITVMFAIFACGFLVGRNTNRDNITVMDPSSASSDTTEEFGKININTASVDELTLLPGIGPKTAERIVEYRTTIRPFRSVSDLGNVEGISNQKLYSLLEYITV